MTGKNMKTIIMALRLLFIMTVLTGIFYPLLVTGTARLTFPGKAGGSIVFNKGNAVGSSFIAQKFENARYFRPRPSASDFGTIPSGATNLGITSAVLKKDVDRRRAYWIDMLRRYGLKTDEHIPADLLFASASGLDPHISPESAHFQAPIIASERHFSIGQVKLLHELIEKRTERPIIGFMGEPRVNVLMLNIDLDGME